MYNQSQNISPKEDKYTIRTILPNPKSQSLITSESTQKTIKFSSFNKRDEQSQTGKMQNYSIELTKNFIENQSHYGARTLLNTRNFDFNSNIEISKNLQTIRVFEEKKLLLSILNSSGEKILQKIEIFDQENIYQNRGYDGSLLFLNFSPSEDMFGLRSTEHGLQVYQTQPIAPLLHIQEDENYINLFAFSHDSKQIATVNSQGEVKIWNSQKGTLKWQKERKNVERGPQQPTWKRPMIHQISYSADDQLLAVQSVFSDIKIYCTKNFNKSWYLPKVVSTDNIGFRFTKDGRNIIFWTETKVSAINLKTGKIIWRRPLDLIIDVSFNEHGLMFILGIFRRYISIFNLATAKLMKTIDLCDGQDTSFYQNIQVVGNKIFATSFNLVKEVVIFNNHEQINENIYQKQKFIYEIEANQ